MSYNDDSNTLSVSFKTFNGESKHGNIYFNQWIFQFPEQFYIFLDKVQVPNALVF